MLIRLIADHILGCISFLTQSIVYYTVDPLYSEPVGPPKSVH
jgi:hypothetical protein